MNQLHHDESRERALVQHANAQEYEAFVQAFIDHHPYADPARMKRWLLRCRATFVQDYPSLPEWFSAPLTERVGRLYREDYNQPCCPTSYRARHYLTYLALRGYAAFDWEWLIATHHLVVDPFLPVLGYPTTLSSLIETAVNLGYERRDARMTLQWAVSRVLLHLGSPHLHEIRATHLAEFEQAVARFGDRTDVPHFFGSRERYQQGIQEEYLTAIHLLQTVLYHQGQIHTEPYRITRQASFRLPVKPQMEAVATRYLALRGLTDQPGTIRTGKRALLKFINWLAETHPMIESWAEVSRDHVMKYAAFLNTVISNRGRPFATATKHGLLCWLSVFFQDVISWGWEGVPSHLPLLHCDLPKLPKSIPRYIPQPELDQLMPAIRALDCPYQRAALLIARWCGARREEIQRLSVDCLDSYPDGTPRLRIPAGKTKRERVVPLNEEAAAAIRLLQAQRHAQRGLRDRQTGVETPYLFMRHGRLISTRYLFEEALTKVCQASGLTTVDNKRRITAHRFRHTVGTALARKGARLRTIQKILGHESVEMALVYIGLTDEDVRQDYQNVLGPDALIAGPGAKLVRSGELAESEIRWIKDHYFQTELELGRCLRLPQEGPCECDLYLTCAKFVTSPVYAPRLRRRRRIEQELGEDARQHGWQREVERHQCTIKRIEQLLADLHEPLDGPEATE
jgi:site-specific recombinase XerD